MFRVPAELFFQKKFLRNNGIHTKKNFFDVFVFLKTRRRRKKIFLVPGTRNIKKKTNPYERLVNLLER